MRFDLKVFQMRMQSDNPWWVDGEIPYYQELNKRAYFGSYYKLVKQSFPHRSVVLMGPRRVGKTVMMYQTIRDLMNEGINPAKIFYFSLDTPIYTNTPLETLFMEAMNFNQTDADGCYVFFDEIQYLKDWEIHLKSLVDSNRKTKFCASGSAAAALRMKSIESGAGRFSDYFLPTLTFAEYVDLNGYNSGLSEIELSYNGLETFYRSDDIVLFNKYFLDYINFGGFPEIALSKQSILYPERIIQKDITDKVIMKDLPGLFGIENTLELQQFFNVLAYRTGEILNYKSVSEDTNTDNKTVKKYLKYLEAAFLLKVLHRVDVTAKRFRNITQFKVYLSNPSLFTGLFGKVHEEDERFPHLVETAVFTQFLHDEHDFLRYANWKRGEVDLVQINKGMQQVDWALEVKWSDNPNPRKLAFFMQNNKLTKAILTSKTVFREDSDLLVIPNSLFAYGVGKIALKKLPE